MRIGAFFHAISLGWAKDFSSDLPRTQAILFKEDGGKVRGHLNFGEHAFTAVDFLGILNHLGQVVQDSFSSPLSLWAYALAGQSVKNGEFIYV